MMEAEARTSWRNTVLLLALTWLTVVALLHPTFMSMVQIWERSETFAHGYVILPIALWLAWKKREELAAIPAHADWRALWVIFPLGLGWLAAKIGGVLVIEQYALAGILIATVWLLMGPRMLRAAGFPLGFLLLMVPNGEGLIPHLIEFTADFTVAAVKLIGIPVYREGTFFTLPSGEWSVVEACSGMRYLIASITLGVLYAYLTYRTPWKRISFSLAAVIVPVFANGMRATMIVLIAHYSDMKLALGVDHYIYGWVWFGIVMLTMFWVGLIWREDLGEEPPSRQAVKPDTAYRPALALAILLALFPVYEGHLSSRAIASPSLLPPSPEQGWSRVEQPFSTWEPHWVGSDRRMVAHYRKGERQVLLYVAWYGAQRQDAELINTQNFMVQQEHSEWRAIRRAETNGGMAGRDLPMAESWLKGHGEQQRILAWQWHRIQGEDGINPYRAKIKLALTKLMGRPDEGAAIIVATPYPEDDKAAAATLKEFLTAHKAALDAQLDQTGKP